MIISSLVWATDYEYEDGRVIYEKTCATCHGLDGNTNHDMEFVVKPRILKKTIHTQEQSFQIIKEGGYFWGANSDMMPTFKYVYEDDEMQEVAYYITKAFNPKGKERIAKLLKESKPILDSDKVKMFDVGKNIFKKDCTTCHGETGNGKSSYVDKLKKENKFIYPYNLRKTLLSEEQIFLYTKFGGKYWGTMEDHMKPWKEKYNDFELKSVAKYVNEEIKKTK